MTLNIPDAPLRRPMAVWFAAVMAVVIAAAVLALTPTRANALARPVPLGTAGSFAVLAGAAVTNTGPSRIYGDLGVSPKTAITGFPPGLVYGEKHSADAVALQAKLDLIQAYNYAAGQSADVTYPSAPAPVELGGKRLNPGVYKAPSSAGITGTLTLDAHGDSSAVWVFQVGSTLTTASGSKVSLVNGASPCNVYWQIGSSATLGTNSAFVGTILARTSITVTTGATIRGRALASSGAVTLDTNTINRSGCPAGGTGGTTGGPTSGGITGATTGAVIGGVPTGGVIGGVPTGGVIGGVPTGGAIGGVPTGGGTSGVPTGGGTGGDQGGVIGGVLPSGGIIGGVLDGSVAGTTSGGTPSTPPGGSVGGPIDGNGHDHGGKPDDHDHGGKPDDQGPGGKPDDHHQGGNPDDHHQGGKPDDHHQGGKPGKDEGYDSDHEGNDKKSA
ncbi:hypothetical protein QFZ22_005007 [Streptomyces canus]|uniref:DUF3494 domain-containing protein n=1 Tax=Streptomyces canus TaxID=58343 RepID=A0AAW8FIZ6_9ACTN|nr:ice-binding family protein [Streptomyces canus]MDQ0909022.1 hypothetical protein [Streptomyces canus]